jgi:hypothetical protein
VVREGRQTGSYLLSMGPASHVAGGAVTVEKEAAAREEAAGEGGGLPPPPPSRDDDWRLMDARNRFGASCEGDQYNTHLTMNVAPPVLEIKPKLVERKVF